MKYCFNYRKSSTAMHTLDELNIKFAPKNLDVLLTYILEHPHQRINARVKEENDIYTDNLIEKFKNFKVEHPEADFAIILPKYDKALADICRQKELKFFFDIVVREWETFNTFITAGVSDIYLVEQMMFEIKDAAVAAHAAGVAVRTFPNIVQRRYEDTSTIKAFFIRPEDVELYEGLVDVMDLYTIDEINQDVVLEVYRDDKQWWGPLKEIILGLDSNIDGRYIIPRFGERRLGCGRKCFKGKRCDVCETVEQLGDNLQKAGIMIKYNKEEEDNGEGTRSESSSNEEDNGSVSGELLI